MKYSGAVGWLLHTARRIRQRQHLGHKLVIQFTRLTLRDIQIIFQLRMEAQFTQITALPTIHSFVFERNVLQAPQSNSSDVRTAEISMQTGCERKCWEEELKQVSAFDRKTPLPEVPVLSTRKETLSCLD
jgi:hypothetical protein